MQFSYQLSFCGLPPSLVLLFVDFSANPNSEGYSKLCCFRTLHASGGNRFDEFQSLRG